MYLIFIFTHKNTISNSKKGFNLRRIAINKDESAICLVNLFIVIEIYVPTPSSENGI